MSTEQIEKFQTEIIIPEGVKTTQKKNMLEFVGPLGKTFKSFRSIPVNIEIVEGKVLLKTTSFRKRDYSILHTARSLIRNICEGLPNCPTNSSMFFFCVILTPSGIIISA